MALTRDLKSIGIDAGNIRNSLGGLNSNEKFFHYYAYGEKIMDSLIKYMPKLMEEAGYL